MNRPETALAALLFSLVMVAPAAAQQVPLTPQAAVSEFCSGCFAYLEFPTLPQAEAASTLASAHQDASAGPTVARESAIVSPTSGLVASIKQ